MKARVAGAIASVRGPKAEVRNAVGAKQRGTARSGARRRGDGELKEGQQPKRAGVFNDGHDEDSDFYVLRLYVAGQTTRSQAALRNLEAICDAHLRGKFRIEVVDLLVSPQLARGDQIFAVPTLVRQLPPPVKKIIGDLSNVERVLVGLDLRPLEGLQKRAEP